MGVFPEKGIQNNSICKSKDEQQLFYAQIVCTNSERSITDICSLFDTVVSLNQKVCSIFIHFCLCINLIKIHASIHMFTFILISALQIHIITSLFPDAQNVMKFRG